MADTVGTAHRIRKAYVRQPDFRPVALRVYDVLVDMLSRVVRTVMSYDLYINIFSVSGIWNRCACSCAEHRYRSARN